MVKINICWSVLHTRDYILSVSCTVNLGMTARIENFKLFTAQCPLLLFYSWNCVSKYYNSGMNLSQIIWHSTTLVSFSSVWNVYSLSLFNMTVLIRVEPNFILSKFFFTSLGIYGKWHINSWHKLFKEKGGKPH